MARVQNTLIGKSSGSVGGATFSTWKGINVLKSKAVSVRNPKTLAQRIQRNRMTVMVYTYRLIADVISVGFKSMAIGKSQYNAFVSQNIINALDNPTGENVDLVPANLLLSKGTIGTTDIASVTGANASPTVAITWDNVSNPVGSSADDLAHAAVFNVQSGVWGLSPTNVKRSVGTLNVTMPENVVTGNQLYAYLFFKSPVSENVSDSTNLTSTP